MCAIPDNVLGLNVVIWGSEGQRTRLFVVKRGVCLRECAFSLAKNTRTASNLYLQRAVAKIRAIVCPLRLMVPWTLWLCLNITFVQSLPWYSSSDQVVDVADISAKQRREE